jgi:predicted glycoside hydrolase/deacetylase ChbG (UPF0249 family)
MILCADDYGLRDDINRAILELCHSGRLTGVSCMTALERCDVSSAKQLWALQETVDIGLHLCLTDEGLPLSPPLRAPASDFPSFRVLLAKALTGHLELNAMKKLIANQYHLFVEKFGRAPDFIDGHLHTHQLPVVRHALIEFVLSLPEASRPYVRNTRMLLASVRRQRLPWLKAAFIGAFGKRMDKELRAESLRTNSGFGGIYSFGSRHPYRDYFPRFMQCLPEANGILVVHPGSSETWRQQELDLLRDYPFEKGALNRFHR